MVDGERELASRCGFALGRLCEAIGRSPLRPLWLSHETARVVARLFSRGAAPLSAETLLGMVAGLPSGMPSIEEAAARRFWGIAQRLWRPMVSREPSGSIPEITNTLRGLAGEGLPIGDLALETPVRLAAQTRWPVPAAALALPPPEAGDAWRDRFMAGLAEEAEGARQRLEGLERDFGRWLSLLPETRADSRLRDAVVLLGTTHALTPRYLVEALGLTRQGAARLLRRLEAAGIVRQATRRQRWIIYLAENAAGSLGVRESTTASALPSPMDTSEIDRALEGAFAALDRSMKRVEG